MSRKLCCVLIALAVGGGARAQAPNAQDAALFLLLPVGARAAGQGNAAAAAFGSADDVWWNPAGLASIRKADATLNHSQSIIGTSDALVVALKSDLGVSAVFANVLDYGGGEVTGPDSLPGGNLYNRYVSLGMSHAVKIGNVLRLGANYKLVQFRLDCSGECPARPTVLASTTAFDVGVQYTLPTRIPVSLGMAVRNLGVKISKDDIDSRDVPSRIHLGAHASYTIPKSIAENAALSVSLDVVDEAKIRRPLPRVGAEFSWDGAVFLRGGFEIKRRDTETGGASLGIGFALKRLTVDFARNFSGLSADAGQPPAYLALRLRF